MDGVLEGGGGGLGWRICGFDTFGVEDSLALYQESD